MGAIVFHAVAFAGFALLFTWVERRWAAMPGERWWRRPLRTDLLYWFAGPLVNQVALYVGLGLLGVVLVGVFGLTIDQGWFERLRHPDSWLAQRPRWAQVVIAFVAADLILYWLHRAYHRIPLLWALHAIHHSPTRIDWLASVRVHPLNGLLSTVILVGLMIPTGIPLDVLAGVLPVLLLLALLGHANVRW